MTTWKRVHLDVSSDGDIMLFGRILPTISATRGYQHIALRVHRIVAEAFHGPRPSEKHVVNHKDRNTRNNNADNLEWLSQKENANHYRQYMPKILTDKQVEEILSFKPLNTIPSLQELAHEYGVSYSAIQAVRSGRTFADGVKESGRRILTDQQIRVIREWKRHKPTAAELGSRYKVSKTTICSIWNGTY